VDQVVQLVGGNSTIPLHKSADGGAIFVKDDNSGFYYASNSEEGSSEDQEFTGGVYVLEMDNDHNVVDYYQVLMGRSRTVPADGRPGGRKFPRNLVVSIQSCLPSYTQWLDSHPS
jgi:hypothetical protein